MFLDIDLYAYVYCCKMKIIRDYPYQINSRLDKLKNIMTPVKAFGEFKNEYNLMQDLLKKIILYSKTLFNNFLK